MNVRQLIAKLQLLPPELPVVGPESISPFEVESVKVEVQDLWSHSYGAWMKTTVAALGEDE